MIKKGNYLPLIYFFIVGIFLLGFFLRAQETLSNNYLFLLDQGRDMMDVKGIVFNHHLTLIGPNTSLGGVFQGPLYYYLLAVPTFLFNGDPWGNMLLMLILSMSVLGIGFYFIKKYFGMTSAIITTILFAVSPEAIAAATYFWNPHPMWLIIVLYIISLFTTIKDSKIGQLALWPIVAASYHFQTAFGVFLFIATFIFILFFYRRLMQKKIFWLSLALSGIFFLPQILFDLRHDFLMSKSVLKVFGGSNQGLFANKENQGYLSLIVSHLYVLKDNFMSSFIQIGIYQLFPLTLLVVSIISVFLGKGKKKYFTENEKIILRLLVGIPAPIILLALIYPFPVRSWFLTGFQSFYLLIFGILLSKLFHFKVGKIVLALLLCIVIIHSIYKLDLLYIHPPNDGGLSKIKGKVAAIDYIYKDAKGKKFGLLIFNPPVLTDAYDYLIWWHGNRKYNYLPHQEKKGLVYLLMEPDSGKPWSYKGWLETVIITGKVLATKELPSGLIVQKRYLK